jgi:long-chain acyl-CoA synthetase
MTDATAYPRYPTIIHALARAAELNPAAPGFMCQERVLNYGEYAGAVAALAARFSELGVAGERIAILMTNSLDAVVALLAGMAARAQVSPLNSAYTERELEPLLRDVESRVLVCDAASVARGHAFAQRLGIGHVVILGPTGITIDELLSAPRRALPLPQAEDASALFFTGGTTGLPKGASHTHTSLMAFCYGVVALWPLPLDRERILNVAPLFHVWGFCFTLVLPIYVRAFMDLLPAYKPAVVLEEFQQRKITTFAGGPAALYLGLRANENFAKTDFSSLKICLSGGAPCPEELLRSWEAATGCVILEGWGMSEGAPINSNPLHGVRKIGSVGVVPPNTEVEVVDLETGERVMPTGERGEIRVRGPQFIKGSAGGESAGDPQRLDLHRRHRLLRRGRLPVSGRPQEGDDHRRRLQRLSARDRRDSVQTSGHSGSGGGRRARLLQRRGDQSVRSAEAGRTTDGGRAAGLLPRRAGQIQGAERDRVRRCAAALGRRQDQQTGAQGDALTH